MNYLAFVVYPPTEEQLSLINLVHFLNGPTLLIILRSLSFIFLLVSLLFWIKIIKNIFNKFIAYTSSALIIISPVFAVLWLCHPIDCLKLLLLVLTGYIFLNKKWFWQAFVVVSVIIFCFNIFQYKTDPAIFHKISLKDSQNEVTSRFSREDSLTEEINIPLPLKRISYNKYFVEYKILMSEFLSFFDVESVFFQEVHPMEQKSVVIFFWPEIFLLLLGIYWIAENKFEFRKNNKFILLFFAISFVNYIFSSGAVYRRFFVILLPISLILAIAFEGLKFFIKNNFVLSKILTIFLVVLIAYGIEVNYYDLSKRTDYWLDNRPLAYDFIFNVLKRNDLRDYERLYITPVIGNPEKYCKYYLGDCKKFIFEPFDLKNNKPVPKTLYAGFAGEFIGSDFKNNISSNWNNEIKGMGLQIIDSKNLRDTIAYKFGNDIVVADYK